MEKNGHSRLLITAAFEPELRLFRENIQGSTNIFVEEVGIGCISAALETSRLISQLQPTHVLFVGSIGAIAKDVSPQTLVSATSTLFLDQALVTGKSYLPEAMTTHITADKQLSYLLTRLNIAILEAPIYTTPSITKDSQIASLIARSANAMFENLELFGVAAACERSSIAWNAVCSVTNTVGENGHEEWKNNYLAAAESTFLFLEPLLRHLTH